MAGKIPTWDDLLEDARNDAVLYRTLTEAHIIGREAALLRAVLFLAADRRQRMEDECRRLAMAPSPVVVVMGKC